jgi:hypothetical protein
LPAIGYPDRMSEHDDAPEPFIERSVPLPFGYVFTARARPSSIKRTAVRLLPWAIYAAMPQGRLAKIVFFAANRFSPLLKQRMR